MKPTEELLQELDHLAEHVDALRRLLLSQPIRRRKAPANWPALDELIEEVSAKWTGPDAVTEIRAQREKGY